LPHILLYRNLSIKAIENAALFRIFSAFLLEKFYILEIFFYGTLCLAQFTQNTPTPRRNEARFAPAANGRRARKFHTSAK
jgi:hypothetical protein